MLNLRHFDLALLALFIQWYYYQTIQNYSKCFYSTFISNEVIDVGNGKYEMVKIM